VFRGLGTTKIWLFPLVWLLVLAITTACTSVQVRPSLGTDIYPHMPIPRPHTARFHESCISSVTFTSAHFCGNVYILVVMARALAGAWPARSPIFVRFWASRGAKLQSSQKWEIFCLGRWWTTVQNVTPLTLSSADKSITVQTHRR